MDLHPTPFPGKLQPSANAKKESNNVKSSREPNRVTTVASRRRQNRVFGTSRTTNATVDKPPQEPTKVFKQLKPPGPPKGLPGKKEPTGAPLVDAKDAVIRPKSETKKTRSVRLQDQQRPLEKGLGKPTPDKGSWTPLSAVKHTVAVGTPYHSAESCSKCKVDRLESAPYWITQIKLAESVGKHFASAAFFRLALECNAEPIRSLKSELKRYMARHNSLPVLTMWKEVCRDYGLLNGEPSLGVICFDAVAASQEEGEQDPRSEKDRRLGREPGGIPQPDSSKEDPSTTIEAVATQVTSTVDRKSPAAATGMTDMNDASDDKLVDETDEGDAVYHCGSEESVMGLAPENKSVSERSDRGFSFSVGGSSSVSKKIRPGKVVGRSKTASNKSQAASELCGEATGKSKEETRRNLSAGNVERKQYQQEK